MTTFLCTRRSRFFHHLSTPFAGSVDLVLVWRGILFKAEWVSSLCGNRCTPFFTLASSASFFQVYPTAPSFQHIPGWFHTTRAPRSGSGVGGGAGLSECMRAGSTSSPERCRCGRATWKSFRRSSRHTRCRRPTVFEAWQHVGDQCVYLTIMEGHIGNKLTHKNANASRRLIMKRGTHTAGYYTHMWLC